MMDAQIYVQETFADIPDEFCDADDSSIIIGETIIEVNRINFTNMKFHNWTLTIIVVIVICHSLSFDELMFGDDVFK